MTAQNRSSAPGSNPNSIASRLNVDLSALAAVASPAREMPSAGRAKNAAGKRRRDDVSSQPAKRPGQHEQRDMSRDTIAPETPRPSQATAKPSSKSPSQTSAQPTKPGSGRPFASGGKSQRAENSGRSKRDRHSLRGRDGRRSPAQQPRELRPPEPMDVTYPEALPVSQMRDEIKAAIRDHQVVVVAGETGSGKTTQLPKMCLELGRGVNGAIGHTQPRRIAARSVAERLAEELKTAVGDLVGYQVRFVDESKPDTRVRVMTDGILLSQMQRDRDLRQYDTIIIDEAHERSLNIDFILGYLKQLLPRRPDLKVIITSATIDQNRFAEHFATPDGQPAPVIEVSGRTFPVEVRYRPLVREVPATKPGQAPTLEDVDQVTGIVEAAQELWRGAPQDGSSQDILVFCSGEREIRDAAEALTDADWGRGRADVEIIPLFARLSAAEQHKVFSPHSGRRIVLATNVAETSLTVPGIRYVIDTGTARISRYSQRTKVQRLPIEPVSQASARQRAGRCGRVAEGICIRLYSQEDFESRPEFTDPEILRTNLASVILAMTSLGLGDIARFPFVDAPDARQIKDGLALLDELHAFDEAVPGKRRRLSRIGRTLAQLPVDPRMGRMLVAASELGALREALIIVAALSIQDPRERPSEFKAQADQQHARFNHERSDFLTFLNLWNYVRGQQHELSSSAFRRLCKREYLHFLRLREWQDLHSQLKSACRSAKLTFNDNAASEDTIHQALLTGLLSHVGLRDREKRDYQGARNARFSIQPGSTLFRRQPDWVMSGELVETSRLWARTNAVIDPAWVERAAGHLVKRNYSEPHWSRKQASAVANERVTLYGIPLVAGRTAAYGAIDPETSRDLFIRHALVEGDWDTHHKFVQENEKLLAQLADLEARARRRDLIVDDDTLFEFYDERIPATVVSGTHFDKWWKGEQRRQPNLLHFTTDFLTTDEASVVDVSDYPKSLRQGKLKFRVTYQFEPGTDADGLTLHIPLAVLNQVSPDGFDYLVPGMREELATAWVKSLPKNIRRSLVPAPDFARRALARMNEVGIDLDVPFTEALEEALFDLAKVRVPADAWDVSKLPDHLTVTYRIEDARGKKLRESKSLDELKQQLAPRLQQSMSAAAGDLVQKGLTSWTLGELPSTFEKATGRTKITGFPALVDHGETVSVEVLGTPSEAARASKLGTRRLLLLNTDVPWKRILGLMTNRQKLALGNNPHGSMTALMDDVLAACVDSVIDDMPGSTVRSPEQFEQALRTVRQQLAPLVLEAAEQLAPVLEHTHEVELALAKLTAPSLKPLHDSVAAHLKSLIYPGFVAATGLSRLRHLDRYVRAMAERLEKAPLDMAKDTARLESVQVVRKEYADMVAGLRPERRTDPDVVAIAWMIEELAVSQFAQRLGTAHPVSEKRIYQAMDEAEAI